MTAAERRQLRALRIRSIVLWQVDGVRHAGTVTNLTSASDPFT
jgi:hypothetical protein